MGALCCHLAFINLPLLVPVVGGLNSLEKYFKQKLIFEKNEFLTLILINFLKCKSDYVTPAPGNISFVLNVNPNPQVLHCPQVFNHKLLCPSYFCSLLTLHLTLQPHPFFFFLPFLLNTPYTSMPQNTWWFLYLKYHNLPLLSHGSLVIFKTQVHISPLWSLL